jgi:hypothetical protein
MNAAVANVLDRSYPFDDTSKRAFFSGLIVTTGGSTEMFGAPGVNPTGVPVEESFTRDYPGAVKWIRRCYAGEDVQDYTMLEWNPIRKEMVLSNGTRLGPSNGHAFDRRMERRVVVESPSMGEGLLRLAKISPAARRRLEGKVDFDEVEDAIRSIHIAVDNGMFIERTFEEEDELVPPKTEEGIPEAVMEAIRKAFGEEAEIAPFAIEVGPDGTAKVVQLNAKGKKQADTPMSFDHSEKHVHYFSWQGRDAEGNVLFEYGPTTDSDAARDYGASHSDDERIVFSSGMQYCPTAREGKGFVLMKGDQIPGTDEYLAKRGDFEASIQGTKMTVEQDINNIWESTVGLSSFREKLANSVDGFEDTFTTALKSDGTQTPPQHSTSAVRVTGSGTKH